MWTRDNPLQQALAEVATGKLDCRSAFDDMTPVGPLDIAALKSAFSTLLGEPAARSPFVLSSLLSLLSFVDDRATSILVRSELLPVLQRLVDEALAGPSADAADLTLLAGVLSRFCTDDAFPYIVKLVRACPDERRWATVFRGFRARHPYTERLLGELGRELPSGFAAVAFLDLANALARAGKLARHPFDSEPGCALLRAFLAERDAERISYGHSAAAALPYLSHPVGSELLEQALAHPTANVRIEAAWAASKLGKAIGLVQLRAWCLDVCHSRRAQAYLRELDHDDAIPPECRAQPFQARATMCEWLAHPAELGRPAKSVEVTGTWEVLWPPTGDRRRLWVLHYVYETTGDAGASQEEAGQGLVGSVTFSLLRTDTASLPPLHVLALHCCWELERRGQLKGESSVEAGLDLLLASNPKLAGELAN